jgi:DNA-binding LytR/AlgR family response regulator
MERKVPKFMTEKLDIIRFFFIVLLGAVALIIAYRPQVILRGLIVNSNQSIFYIISLIILGFITLITSRVLFYKTNKRKPLTFKNFCTWIILEIVSIILVLSVFAWSINEPNTRSFTTIIERTTISVFSVLFIPYLVSWLYFSLKEKEKELKEVLAESEEAQLEDVKGLVNFSDEKGVLRMSLRAEDLLYLKSADNYVYIYYLNNKKEIVNYLLRNTLKNIEENNSNTNLIRCHRFYMVNSRNVKLLRKAKDGLLLELDTESLCEIPVSKTYLPAVSEFFAN